MPSLVWLMQQGGLKPLKVRELVSHQFLCSIHVPVDQLLSLHQTFPIWLPQVNSSVPVALCEINSLSYTYTFTHLHTHTLDISTMLMWTYQYLFSTFSWCATVLWIGWRCTHALFAHIYISPSQEKFLYETLLKNENPSLWKPTLLYKFSQAVAYLQSATQKLPPCALLYPASAIVLFPDY